MSAKPKMHRIRISNKTAARGLKMGLFERGPRGGLRFSAWGEAFVLALWGE